LSDAPHRAHRHRRHHDDDFEDGEKLAESARGAAPRIGALLRRAHDGDVPVVYVNDNAGEWSASREELVERMGASDHADMLEELRPGRDTAFVMKGRHSIFYGTAVEHLLRELGVERVVLAGQVTEAADVRF